jgi:hypothetical protein
MFVPHRKQKSQLSATEMALLFICGWCSYLTVKLSSRPVTEIALLFICRCCLYLTGSTSVNCLLRGWLYFLYVDGVWTSQETHLRACTACYGDRFTFLYVYGVFTSHETHVRAYTNSYWNSFTFYMWMMFVPYRKHKCQLSVTRIASPFICRWCLYLTGSSSVSCLLGE